MPDPHDEQACAALEKHRARADAAERERDRLCEADARVREALAPRWDLDPATQEHVRAALDGTDGSEKR